MLIPVLTIPTVYHVGTLIKTERAPAGISHEGSALSVSLCPAARESIARLGGQPLLRMTRPSALFLDALALTEAERNDIRHWGLSTGLAEMRASWLAWSFDDEIEEWSAMHCLSR